MQSLVEREERKEAILWKFLGNYIYKGRVRLCDVILRMDDGGRREEVTTLNRVSIGTN
jgi:hypothetical protein